MNTSAPEPRHVAVEVLPPLPADAARPPVPASGPQVPPPPFAGLRTFYHPAAGVVILGLDWLIFGTEAALDFLTGFLAMPLLCSLAFFITFVVLYVIQTRWGGDKKGSAFGKAFLGAFLVAIPFPITGTLLGAAIIALSGLPRHPADAVKQFASKINTSALSK
jgi:hypothetical protein